MIRNVFRPTLESVVLAVLLVLSLLGLLFMDVERD